MIDRELKELKNIGHKLLDMYINMDISMGQNYARKKAYHELEKRVKSKYSAHFSKMESREEILYAHSKIRRMIDEKERILEGRRKNIVAPNVMELQRMANDLNPHLKSV